MARVKQPGTSQEESCEKHAQTKDTTSSSAKSKYKPKYLSSQEGRNKGPVKGYLIKPHFKSELQAFESKLYNTTKEYGELSNKKFEGLYTVLNLHRQAMVVVEKEVFSRFDTTDKELKESYLGRVINALAKPINDRGEISTSESQLIESPAPGIISRRSVHEPLQTGLIAIDSMIPIGRDGQIFLSANARIRPVINVGISVSKVGSAAQIKAMKQVAGKLKLELAQCTKLEAFAQFASDLDKANQNQLAKGQRLSQSAPLTVEEQIITIYTRTNGYLDSLEIGQVRKFLVELRAYLKMNKPQFQEIISSTKTFTREAEALLKEAIQEQMELFLLREQVEKID
ncbi:uncharacterized protein LOC114755661 [Neltuma alba]|uniref:uncharacterized protein LOC114755661 n=1 Tax=Neltuma alba TaxID=207710 RepID=UPI0010A49C20|nr:uncharacterized protein LOC114755661 [Prosopis alba]